MLKFYIVEDYEYGEDGKLTTLFDEMGNVVMCGDYYHDHIDDTIEGFFDCLNYLEIPYNIYNAAVNTIRIDG